MSSSRTKKNRRMRIEPSNLLANSKKVKATADAILAVDLSDLKFQSRLDQVVIGLCRAAFSQSKAVSSLATVGMLFAASPNQRLISEVALRLDWLYGLSSADRHKAVDTMLDKDRSDIKRLVTHLDESGYDANFDLTAMDSFELDYEVKGAIHQQATRLKPAVDSSPNNPWSIYASWLTETPYSHASGSLAGKYAPTHDNIHISKGVPDPNDPELEGLPLVLTYIVFLTGSLLRDEGLPKEFIDRIESAFSSI